MRYACAACLVLLLSPLGASRSEQPALPVSVSLVQLIATPEKYDGKLVAVEGFLPFGGVDGDALFLGRVDYENGLLENSVWVDRTKEMLRDQEKIYDNYVVVVGVFRREDRPAGYVPHLSGRITDVRRCDFISDPDRPMARRLKQLHGDQPKRQQ